MFWLFVCYIGIALFGAKLHLKGNAEYLSVENTQAIKGIFIIMVFFSHFNSYIVLSGTLDGVYNKLFLFIGQAMVAPFLFYSGYGVMESIKRKQNVYIASFPKNRILATLFNFDCAVLLYLVLSIVLGNKITIKQVLLSFIGWEALGNSNWYIFVILFLYLVTYIVFKLLGNKSYYLSVFILGGVVCVVIYLTYRFQIKEGYWYDTALCYVFGMGYSLIKTNVEKIMQKHITIWAVSLAGFAGLFFILRGRGIAWDMVANLMFTAAIIVFSMYVTLNNRVLNWCGRHLFELYILQRIPMIVFQRLGLQKVSILLYFVVCAAVTVGLSICFCKVVRKAWKAINSFA